MATRTPASPSCAAPAPASSASASAALASTAGPSVGAALLTRALLGPDHERANLSANTIAADGSVGPPSPSSRGRSASLSGQRRSTSRTAGATHGDAADGELEEPPPRNMAELNDMIQELHRNQLWFIYVFATAREQFQSGPQQQVDSLQNTLSELGAALETVTQSRARMLDIQRRVDAVKATVAGWRQKQITEAEVRAATVEAAKRQQVQQQQSMAPR